MQSFTIQDINDFMHKLLVSGSFDTFELVRSSVRTFAVYSIDGTRQASWYDTDERQSIAGERAGNTYRHTSGDETGYLHGKIAGETAGSPSEHSTLQSPSFVQWKDIKPVICSIVQGKRKPLSLQIVFRLADYNCKKLLLQSGLDFQVNDIDGLYLNISYSRLSQAESLVCTTGTSLRIFTLDKSLEHTWDDMISRLFRSLQIPWTTES